MGIVRWPDDVDRHRKVVCAICDKLIPTGEATAGLQNTEGLQVFACNSHFLGGAQFIVGWADFVTKSNDAVSRQAQATPGYYVEERRAEELTLESDIRTLWWDLARHLYVRQFCGGTTIITDKPSAMKAVLRRQWAAVERQVQHQRSSILKATRIAELARQLAHAQRIRFVNVSYQNWLETDPAKGDVVLVAPAELSLLPVIGQTVYVTCTVDTETEKLLEQLMPYHGLLVKYRIGPAQK